MFQGEIWGHDSPTYEVFQKGKSEQIIPHRIMSFYHLLAWRQARSSINLHGLAAAGKNCAIFSMSSYLVAPRKEVVVEELLPVEASQAEVEALPVGAVEFPLQRQRAVVGPVES